jgi:putative tryptophan/tyrosine transport system substrate-binding protein
MRLREFLTLVGGVAAWPLRARAQQAALPVIGFIGGGFAKTSAKTVRSFRQRLAEVGYVEGRNVAVEYRWADYQADRLPALAAEMVRIRVAVIATAGALAAALAAKAATSTIPIVFQIAVDPVEAGLVASMNQPGGNVTGVTSLNRAPEPKRLEVLHEFNPKATTLVELINPSQRNLDSRMADAQAVAHTLGLQVHILNAGAEADFKTAFASAAQMRAGGLAIAADPLFANHSEVLATLAAQYAMPTISLYRAFASAGGLASYGNDLMDQYRQLGIYTGRILNGEKPSTLPVEQATKIELIVNLKTAGALGIDDSAIAIRPRRRGDRMK